MNPRFPYLDSVHPLRELHDERPARIGARPCFAIDQQLGIVRLDANRERAEARWGRALDFNRGRRLARI